MNAHKDQLPPPLPDQQVLETHEFVNVLDLSLAFKDQGLIDSANEVLRFIAQGEEKGYLPLLIRWKSKELCLVAYYPIPPDTFIHPNELNDSQLNELVMEAYCRARTSVLNSVPVLTCRFKTPDQRPLQEVLDET